jgi:hypothetical protein
MKKGCGSDEERPPAVAGQDPGRGGEEDPVSLAQLRALDLPPQYLELVTDYDQLEIFAALGAQSQDS